MIGTIHQPQWFIQKWSVVPGALGDDHQQAGTICKDVDHRKNVGVHGPKQFETRDWSVNGQGTGATHSQRLVLDS